jgi:hypothetical protein
MLKKPSSSMSGYTIGALNKTGLCGKIGLPIENPKKLNKKITVSNKYLFFMIIFL